MDNLIMRRAAEIHAERRTRFDFGPPPHGLAMDLTHAASASRWTVRISDHIPLEGVSALAEMLSRTCSSGDVDVVAFGLAYVAAATETVAGMDALSRGGGEA